MVSEIIESPKIVLAVLEFRSLPESDERKREPSLSHYFELWEGGCQPKRPSMFTKEKVVKLSLFPLKKCLHRVPLDGVLTIPFHA